MGGRQYALPLYTNNVALYVNDAMLEAAGHDAPPTTCEELRQVFADMAALGPESSGLSLGSSHWGVFQWYPFIWQNAGEIIDAEGALRVAEPEAVEALEHLTALHLEDGSLPPNVLTARSWDEVNAPFIQERAGMLMSGDWAMTPIREGNPDLEFTVVPLPRGAEAATVIGGYNIAVNATTDSPEAAVEFVQAITGPEAQPLREALGAISAHQSGQSEEALAAYDEAMQTFIRQAAEGRARPAQTQWAEIDTRLAEAWDEAIRGAASPQEALDAAAADIEPMLD